MAERLSDDEWQARVTAEAARAVAEWLQARGRLEKPIASLTQRDLECIATAVISRWVVCASERIKQQPEDSEDIARLLLP